MSRADAAGSTVPCRAHRLSLAWSSTNFFAAFAGVHLAGVPRPFDPRDKGKGFDRGKEKGWKGDPRGYPPNGKGYGKDPRDWEDRRLYEVLRTRESSAEFSFPAKRILRAERFCWNGGAHPSHVCSRRASESRLQRLEECVSSALGLREDWDERYRPLPYRDDYRRDDYRPPRPAEEASRGRKYAGEGTSTAHFGGAFCCAGQRTAGHAEPWFVGPSYNLRHG